MQFNNEYIFFLYFILYIQIYSGKYTFYASKYTVKKNPDKLPDGTGLPRYFQIEPDLNPVDGWPDRSG